MKQPLKEKLKQIGGGHLLNESTWDNRKFGEPLPTMADYKKAHEGKINEAGMSANINPKFYKDIIKAERQLAKSVDKLASVLDKQGFGNPSMLLKGNYIQDVQDFVHKFLKGFIKDLS